ncbi:hypothetical protein ACWDA3_19135 [Nonomuraea rubra]
MATVKKPLTTCCISWARDGRRVLLTVENKGRTAGGDACVWDVSEIKPRKVAVLRNSWVYGWWDENHLLAEIPAGNGYRTALVSLDGETTRILATYSAKWSDKVFMSFFRQ